MSKFSCYHQPEIVDEIFKKWNTTHPMGVKAALSDAAWQGFLIGMEMRKDYNEK